MHINFLNFGTDFVIKMRAYNYTSTELVAVFLIFHTEEHTGGEPISTGMLVGAVVGSLSALVVLLIVVLVAVRSVMPAILHYSPRYMTAALTLWQFNFQKGMSVEHNYQTVTKECQPDGLFL